jgi:hypothetical protein
MSIAGKILAIFNVLAAIAFVVVAGIDWGQRQRWAFAVYRHDLAVDGLPIDAKEQGPDLKPRVDKLGEPWFGGMFQQAGGQPVKTQAEEVERLHREVAAPGTPPEKLARYLHAVARTFRDRDRYARIVGGQEKAEEPELQKEFDAQFDGVKEVGADGHKHSDEERKANAARLIFLLGQAQQEDANADYFTSPAYRRLQVVSGLSAATRAIDDQALAVLAMTDEAIRTRHAELDQFVYDLGQVVYEDQNLSEAVERLERFLQTKKDDVDKQKQIVTEHKVEIKQLTERLQALRQQTAKDLDAQARHEQEVMRRLIELRDTAKKNQDLERQIRELEGVK